MNHDHKDDMKKHSTDDQYDNDLEVVDEYKFDKKKKRKTIKDHSTLPNKKRRNDDNDFEIVDEYIDDDSQDDENLKIIDDYNVDGQDDNNLNVIDQYNDDEQDDNNLNVIDEYNDDGQADNGLKIIDRYDHSSTKKNYMKYKSLYEDCLKSSRRLRERIKKIQYLNNRRYKNLKLETEKALKHQKFNYDKQTKEFDVNCKEKINAVKRKCDETIKELQTQHRHAFEKLEDECEQKVRRLTNHIKSLEEDDESLNTLTDAIFNCTTMQDIFEIQHLVKNHQIDLVVQRHLKTLQNLFFSLSFGILPICQPQREKITDKQRKFVEKIQSVSGSRAKGLIKEHRQDLTNLFAIIEDSLKLARNSYNKYGTDRNDSI